MLIVRAWPEVDRPAHRPHVEDGWPKVTVDYHDYTVLAELGDDVLVLDWDIAPSRSDVLTMCRHVEESPDKVLAAPYLLERRGRPDARWSLGFLDGVEFAGVAGTGAEFVHMVGFGMTYLPQTLLLRYVAENPGQRLGDVEFCLWHHHNVEPSIRVLWDVRPVHLNYAEAADGKVTAEAVTLGPRLPAE